MRRRKTCVDVGNAQVKCKFEKGELHKSATDDFNFESVTRRLR